MIKQQGIEEFDIKRMEEQTAELEKDLIVKELETLDVLEELGATKRMVEELKRQLRTEALKCFPAPNFHSGEQTPTSSVKEMEECFGDLICNHEQHMLGDSSPSPDMILMELKQAKMNLGKTINDLGVIQTSVESLNRKMKKEKSLLAKRRDGVALKFLGPSTLDEERKPIPVKSQVTDDVEFKDVSENSFNTAMELPQVNVMGGQIKNPDGAKSDYSVGVAGNEHTKASLRTAELRLLAARKMEEAAKAAEAVALAEVEALSGIDNSAGFSLQEPETMVFNFKDQSFLNSNTKKSGEYPKKNEDVMVQLDETNPSKLNIEKKLKEAKEELNLGKKALEEALNRVELANRKQLVAEETLRRWVPEHKGHAFYYPSALNNFLHPSALANFRPSVHQASPLHSMSRPDLVNRDSKPVLRSTISMRDVLSRKQGLSGDNIARRDGQQTEKQKVALSQMLHLHAPREDLTFPSKTENDRNYQKNPSTERKRFGFIQIALPLMKQSKKKPQSQS